MCVLQQAVHPHPGPFKAVGVVVQQRQRTTLLTGVAVRERMVLVSSDADHLVTVDVDEDSADRSADAAEATDRLHTPATYSREECNVALRECASRAQPADRVRRVTALHGLRTGGRWGSGCGRRATSRKNQGNRRNRRAATNTDSTSLGRQPRFSK